MLWSICPFTPLEAASGQTHIVMGVTVEGTCSVPWFSPFPVAFLVK